MAKLSRLVNPRRGLTVMLVAIATTWATGASGQEADGEEELSEAAVSAEGAAPADAEGAEDGDPGEPDSDARQESGGEDAAEGGDEVAGLGDATTDDGGATAEDGGEGPAEEAETSRFPRDHFGHRFQGGVSLGAGTGYQFEIAYGGDKCYQEGEENDEASVCDHRSPVYFDFQLSFGVTEGLEVLLEYRLGLLEETYLGAPGDDNLFVSRPMAVGLGVRYFVSPLSRVKFSIGVIIDVDFTDGLDTDVAVRPIFGMQVEIVRWVGFFLQGSVNLNFIRAFGISLDGTGGFQFRFP